MNGELMLLLDEETSYWICTILWYEFLNESQSPLNMCKPASPNKLGKIDAEQIHTAVARHINKEVK